MAKKKVTEPKKPVFDLPAGMISKDVTRPSWKDKEQADWKLQFELWYVEGTGWVIPTLPIANAKRGSLYDTRRTYAIGVNDSKIYTVGRGPHVKTTVEVYVRPSRVTALQKFLDIKNKGLESAQTIRDRISTRRSNTILRRATGDLW